MDTENLRSTLKDFACEVVQTYEKLGKDGLDNILDDLIEDYTYKYYSKYYGEKKKEIENLLFNLTGRREK